MKAKIGDLVYVSISQYTTQRDMGIVIGIYAPIEEGLTKNPCNFAYDVLLFKDKRRTPIFESEVIEII